MHTRFKLLMKTLHDGRDIFNGRVFEHDSCVKKKEKEEKAQHKQRVPHSLFWSWEWIRVTLCRSCVDLCVRYFFSMMHMLVGTRGSHPQQLHVRSMMRLIKGVSPIAGSVHINTHDDDDVEWCLSLVAMVEVVVVVVDPTRMDESISKRFGNAACWQLVCWL